MDLCNLLIGAFKRTMINAVDSFISDFEFIGTYVDFMTSTQNSYPLGISDPC